MRLGKNQLFISMWVASFIMAFALPGRPDQTAILGSIVGAVGAVVPAVDNVRQISAIPEVASAYFAVMWILVLLWLPPYFTLSDEQINSYTKATKRKTAFLFFPVLLVVTLWFLLTLPITGTGRIAQAMLNVRFGLGLVGGAAFCGLPLFIRGMLMWIHYLPRVLDESDGSNIKGDSRRISRQPRS
jgi:hypothetical protein